MGMSSEDDDWDSRVKSADGVEDQRPVISLHGHVTCKEEEVGGIGDGGDEPWFFNHIGDFLDV